MSTEKALLRAIVEDPDDDLPRLAYADWLEERGDEAQLARAEFIRVQIALARMADNDLAWPTLVVREALLLQEHGERWGRQLAGMASQPVFRRGFVAEVTASITQLRERGPEMLDFAPVTWVRLCGEVRGLKALAEHPVLERVEGLDLSEQGMKPPDELALLRSPRLTRLRRLRVGGWHLQEVFNAWLRGYPPLLHLAHLWLEAYLQDDRIRRLAAWPPLANVKTLGLAGNMLTAAGLESLLQRLPTRLTFLDLSRNDVGDDGAGHLTRADGLYGLSDLRLAACGINANGLGKLGRSPLAVGLTSLDLASNPFSLTEARLLAEASRLTGLRHLSVSSCGLGDAGLKCLVESPNLTRLTRLWVQENDIGPAGVAALADSPMAAQLVHLDLSHNSLSDRGATALARSPHLRRLTHLDLTFTEIGSSGLRDLAESPILANVVRLFLAGYNLDVEGVEALAAAPHFGPHATLVLVGRPEAPVTEQLAARFGSRVEYH